MGEREIDFKQRLGPIRLKDGRDPGRTKEVVNEPKKI
jgi:hypothetical protein